MALNYKLYYKRHLPHYQPAGATLFITFRLTGSIPHEVMQQLMDEVQKTEEQLDRIEDAQERTRQADVERRRTFGKWDAALDANTAGPHWLRDRQVAALVAEALRYRDGRNYMLHAYCLMSNHAHVVCAPLEKPGGGYQSLSTIFHSLKGYTAHEANQYLGRSGDFWQHESYDHVIRSNAEFHRVIAYVLNNPVKAGFVKEWQDWEWSYCRASC
jgi:putative transposase